MRPIDPHLFTRLMRLPPGRRADLLEFIGATPLADLQLEQLIDMMSSSPLSPEAIRPRPEMPALRQ